MPDRPLKSPVLAGIFLGPLILRRRRPLFDPGLEKSDLLRAKRLALGRHPRGLVRIANALNQETACGVAGLDDRTMPAAFAHGRDGVEPQFRLLLQRSMTGIAPRFQYRLDVPEIIDLVPGP
jgi:hypothetical protein